MRRKIAEKTPQIILQVTLKRVIYITMRTALITLLLASMPVIQADEVENRSVFAYSKVQGLGGQLRSLHDIIVLKDGTQLRGSIRKLPSLSFSFGLVDLDPDEIVSLTTVPTLPGKVQIRTVSGDTYIASMNSQEITFLESISEGTSRLAMESLSSLKELDFVLFKPRSSSNTGKEISSMWVTLQNGDTFPVAIEDREIVLSSGWKEWAILSRDVISLSFNGGIYGRINDQGKEVDLPLSFLKSSFINLSIPSKNKAIRLPWEKIEKISRYAPSVRSAQPEALFALNRSIDIPSDVTFIDEPPVLFAADETLDIPQDVAFVDEPPVLFASNEELDLPKGIQFEEKIALVNPVTLAVGESFNLDDLEVETPEEVTEDTSDEVEFVKGTDKSSLDSLVAVGEDFNLDELEGERPEETTEDTSDEVEFVKGTDKSSLDSLVAVGEDFNLDELEGERPEEATEDTADEVEFVVAPENSEQQKKISYGTSRKSGMSASIPSQIADNDLPVHSNRHRVHEKPELRHGMVHLVSKYQSVPGYYIKPRKVTNLEYKQFVDAIQYRTPSHWAGGEIPEGIEDDPVVNVSYKDAFLYSVWAGKRLPSLDELERAMDEDLIAVNEMDDYLEWTSTPTLHTVNYQQPPNITHTGSKHTSSHQACGKGRTLSIKNEYSNNNTSFRVASDAH